MQFQKIRLSDRELLTPYFYGLSSRTCDLTPGTLLMWHEVNFAEYCILEDVLYTRFITSHGGVYYSLPLGREMKAGILRLLQSEKKEDKPLVFVSVPKEYLPLFEELEASVTVRENRDSFDYLYLARDLMCLSGKKYAKKRNLISQFDRAYPDHRFVALTEENRAETEAFFHKLVQELGESASRVEELERQGTFCVLSDPALCGMQGGVLYVGEEIAGFSLGEIIGDVLYTHIEKASRAYKGVYQKLTNLFVNTYAGEQVRYVNREDDAGDAGLRRAKLDYYPTSLLEKYTVEIK